MLPCCSKTIAMLAPQFYMNSDEPTPLCGTMKRQKPCLARRPRSPGLRRPRHATCSQRSLLRIIEAGLMFRECVCKQVGFLRQIVCSVQVSILDSRTRLRHVAPRLLHHGGFVAGE